MCPQGISLAGGLPGHPRPPRHPGADGPRVEWCFAQADYWRVASPPPALCTGMQISPQNYQLSSTNYQLISKRFALATPSWVSWVSWVSWPGTIHAQRLRAFPVNCQAPHTRRQDGGVPSQAPRTPLTGTAAFQAAAFPATDPDFTIRRHAGGSICLRPGQRAVDRVTIGQRHDLR